MNQNDHARSPWAFQSYAKAAIQPIDTPINGEIIVPGSKSYTNRALIIAALAEGTSTLKGVLKSDDSYWCIDSLKKLGVAVSVDEKRDEVTIEGRAGKWPEKNQELFIGAAGTIARFLPGALALCEGGEWVVDGISQLRKRPLQPLINALRQLGAKLEYLSDNAGLPLKIYGTGLSGGTIHISGRVSSQFLSGLLIAAPYAKEKVTIEVTDDLVQPAYVSITMQMMRQFGAEVVASEDFRSFTVYPQRYRAQEITLEADASTACYFLSLAALTKGRMKVSNISVHSNQPDAQFVDVLEQMGCNVLRGKQGLEVQGPAKIKGGFAVDMKPMSDQALTIGALAPFADAPIHVYNVEHIRAHESDRIAVLCSSLQKMGVRIEEHRDGFTVYPGDLPQGTVLDPHDDHRNAMVFALIGTQVNGVQILDPGCVSKTCPNYFDLLRSLGVQVRFE